MPPRRRTDYPAASIASVSMAPMVAANPMVSTLPAAAILASEPVVAAPVVASPAVVADSQSESPSTDDATPVVAPVSTLDVSGTLTMLSTAHEDPVTVVNAMPIAVAVAGDNAMSTVVAAVEDNVAVATATPVVATPADDAWVEVPTAGEITPPIVVDREAVVGDNSATVATVATAVAEATVATTVRVDTHDLVQALHMLNFKVADAELAKILAVWPEYPKESRLAYKTILRLSEEMSNSPFLQALISINKDKKGGGDDARRHYVSTNITQVTAIIRWLMQHLFDVNEALNHLVEKMMCQRYLYSSSPTSPPRVDMAHYENIMEFSDLFRVMCNAVDVARLRDSVKRNLKDYPPIVLEVLISCGLNVLEVVEDHTIAWWIMRSATAFIAFNNKQSLACAFISKLVNSPSFDFHPRHFTGCADFTAYEMLNKRPQFIQHLADEIEPGVIFINTVNDDRIIANLINIGSPPPDQSIFHETLTNKLALLRRSYANNKAIFAQLDPRDEVNAFAYYCKNGDYTAQHFECLKFIAQEAPDTTWAVVQDNPEMRRIYICWTALHIACNRFSLKAWAAKNTTSTAEMTANSMSEIPDSRHTEQETILEWIYNLYGDKHFALDIYERTPLMCLPIDMSDEGREITRAILGKFAKYDVRGLRARGCNISEMEYIRYVMDWQRIEDNARRQDVDLRWMHANKKAIDTTAPWLKVKQR